MTKPNFLYFMDGFNKQLEQQWEISISSYGEEKYGELFSIFDKDHNGKLSNVESQSLWSMVEEAAKEMGDSSALETEEADKLVAKYGWNFTGEDLINVLATLRGNVVWALAGGNQSEVESVPDKKIKSKEDLEPGNGIPSSVKYNKKNLEKLYPKNQYEIKFYSDIRYLSVEDKKSGITVASYSLHDDGAFITLYNDEGHITYVENAQGELERISYPNGDVKYPLAEKLVSNLHLALDEKAKISLLGDSIRQLTPNNIIIIYDSYRNNDDDNSSLISDIVNVDGMSASTKKTFILHIFQQMLATAKERGVYINDLEVKFNSELSKQSDSWFGMNADYLDVFMNQLYSRIQTGRPDEKSITPANGKVDENFCQGHTGDCWLLASINAIRRTPKGRQILNDSIKLNKDGSIDVTLKGPKKTYHISKAELYGNTQLGTGDADIRALEIAVEKFFEEERGSSATGDRLDINGNQMHVAYEILTGQGGWDHFYGEGTKFDSLINNGGEYSHNPTDEEIDNINKPNMITTVSISSESANKLLIRTKEEEGHAISKFTCPTTKGDFVPIHSDHAYTVSRTDSTSVYLINPWDSSTEIIMSKEQFKKFFENINQHELT